MDRRIEDWLPEFMEAHTERFPGLGWEKLQPIYWGSLSLMFTRRGVKEHEAHEASVRLVFDPPASIADHPVKLMAAVEAIWREAQAVGTDGVASNRDAAVAASRNCPHCGGGGLATVYRPARQTCPDIPDERWARIPAQIAAWCVCSMGHWVKTCQLRSEPGLEQGMRHLADVLAGNLRWRLEPPNAHPEAAENARFDTAAEANWDRTPIPERDYWRDMVRRKLPELCARGPFWMDGLAKAWAYDPTFVVGDPPVRDKTAQKRPDVPRTPFVEWSTVERTSRPADASCVTPEASKPDPPNFDDWDTVGDLGPQTTETS